MLVHAFYRPGIEGFATFAQGKPATLPACMMQQEEGGDVCLKGLATAAELQQALLMYGITATSG